MQSTVILALSTMLAIVCVVFVFMLWRTYVQSTWPRRLRAAVARARGRRSSPAGTPIVVPTARASVPALPSTSGDDLSSRSPLDMRNVAGTHNAPIWYH